MRRILALAPLLFLTVSGCSKGGGGALHVDAHAQYYRCEETCPSLQITMTIRNETDKTYCIPEDFLSDRLSEHLVFIDATGRQNSQVVPMGLPTIELSEDKKRMFDQDRLTPVYLFAPGSTRKILVYTEDRFSLPPTGGTVLAGIPTFVCGASSDSDGDYEVKSLKVKVSPYKAESK